MKGNVRGYLNFWSVRNEYEYFIRGSVILTIMTEYGVPGLVFLTN